MLTPKQTITIVSTFLILVGVILAFIWTTPVELFISIGLVVSGIILFLLYITISVAGWADNLVSGDKTEISFSLDPEQGDLDNNIRSNMDENNED